MFVLVAYKVEQAGAVDFDDPRIHAVVGRDDPIKVDKDLVDDGVKIPAVLASEHVVLHAPNALTTLQLRQYPMSKAMLEQRQEEDFAAVALRNRVAKHHK